MPNLSIKNVPEELAEALRERALRNHRSLQGELMAIVESAAQSVPTRQAPEDSDDLLQALDHIVAASDWGAAPVLSREQANAR